MATSSSVTYGVLASASYSSKATGITSTAAEKSLIVTRGKLML
jgi:hypothetical protein